MSYIEVVKTEPVTNEVSGLTSMKCTFRAVKKNELGDGLMNEHFVMGNRFFPVDRAPKVGDISNGSIMTLPTSPYKIEENTVSKITVVACGDETPLGVANEQLKKHKASVLVNGKASIDYKPAGAKKGAKLEDVPADEEK